ncbi:BrnA antitoxin family protein [Photobacterium sp. TY1-4]|uniref:BrnA antitoxin family protein n=1 Tax=Photobacterium sp. TY1-4 TaxID=2899122 RepID=UPI0021BE45D7|nr:BrnA antitoxin family protein [Photobacterium sp. TY1-4]UXI00444.1 BrnA antitoxin family protein [Photobacterium sp. TY1-4]
MSTKPKKIDSTIEAWESGQLGRDEKFVEKVTIEPSLVDDSLELQMISIRLQKGLLDDLKNIAQIRGIGYQPLIKQILKRFADSEMKMILKEMAAEEARKEAEAAGSEPELMQACG